MKPTRPWHRRLIDAARGVRCGLQDEFNFRVHLLLAYLVLTTAALVGVPVEQWALLVLAVALVFVVELLNTALERTVDLVRSGRNPMAGYAKDVAAGAVLVMAMGAAGVGLLLLGPRLGHLPAVLIGLWRHQPAVFGLLVAGLAVGLANLFRHT